MKSWELKERGLGAQYKAGLHLICYLSGAVHLCMLTNCATGLGLLVIGFQRKHFLWGISIINSVWTHPQMNNEINNKKRYYFWQLGHFSFPAFFSSACFLLINFPRSCPPFHKMNFISTVGHWKCVYTASRKDNNNTQVLHWLRHLKEMNFFFLLPTADIQFSRFVTTGGFKYNAGKDFKQI